MNPYITGSMIRALRERVGLTQAALAKQLCISDKTVSKWETGKGCPDVSLLEPIASAFGISVAELMSGKAAHNFNVCANMLRSKFYICPVCGNVLHAMGESSIHCHGIALTPAVPRLAEEDHRILAEAVEDEWFVRVEHPMTKQHHIRFLAALSPDRLQLVRLYPEGNAEARLQLRGVQKLFCCCSRDGLFCLDLSRPKKYSAESP